MKFFIVHFKPFETSNVVYKRYFLSSESAFRFSDTKSPDLVLVSRFETSGIISFLQVVLYACLCFTKSFKLKPFPHGDLSD